MMTLEDNSLVRLVKKNVEKRAWPQKEYFQFEIGRGQSVFGQILLPPNLQREMVGQYPLLIQTQSAPGSQLVTEEFRVDWSIVLASSRGTIVASIDGRGSGGRGSHHLFAIYKRLGTLEILDQMAGASYLISRFPFINKDRVAIFGQAYGGFMVVHALGSVEDDIFKCGIAVSPIVDLNYYDSAFSEKWMGLAANRDNYRGYDNANGSSKAEHFRNKGFLLLHGTADGKVHFQHGAQLSKSLTEAEIDFRTQVYPDGRDDLLRLDSVSGRHAYQTMSSFLSHGCWTGANVKVSEVKTGGEGLKKG